MNVARLRKSREQWKCLAGHRRLENERLKRRCARLAKRCAVAETKCESLQSELSSSRTSLVSLPAPVILKVEVRVICVMMFLVAHMPCNAVVRALSFLTSSKRLALPWIPDPSSVVNWVARAGLGLLDAVAPSSAPWVAIIDSSIAYGKAKMLVCLRVRLDHFAVHRRAVGLADVECVGLEIRDTWTGEDVCEALVKIFTRSGDPAAILKDQGPDLARGVRLLGEQRPGILVVRDLGAVPSLRKGKGGGHTRADEHHDDHE